MNNPIIKKDIINYINSNVFISHLNIPLYETPVISDDCQYLNNLRVIIEKLDVLLKVPHQEFWCHIFFDSSVLNSIQSYFKYVNRPYEIALMNISRPKIEIEVYKKYYLVILRIISKKENLSVFSNLDFGSLIYDNFIIDIPFIFDLCSIYGDGNSEMISKIIIFIFECQPKYLNDFQQYAQESMKFLEEKINNLSNDSNLMDRSNLMTIMYRSAEQKSEELLYYIIDIFYSWNTLLDAIKTETKIYTILFDILFHKSLEISFQKYVPIIQSNIDKFETLNPENLKKLLSVSCYYLVSVWRKIFSAKFFGNFHEKSSILTVVRSPEENYELINSCLSMISSCQEYYTFADALQLMFPIERDSEVILEAVKSDKDQFYEDFVRRSLKEIMKDIDTRQAMFSPKCLIDNDLSAVSGIKPIKESEFCDKDILQIIEIFPSLSVKDIKNYMECYTCSQEVMLDALLAEAVTVDFVKNISNDNRKFDSVEESQNFQTILNNHYSIYDGDALDTGNVTYSQLHIGKKQTELSQNVDPQLRKMILNIVVQQNEEEEEEALQNENLTYDDEFDDVYGISHDNAVIDNKIDESNYESDKPSQNKNESKIEEKGNIMEPSNIKYSNYSKNQFKKKKYQENQQKVTNGEKYSKRMGSHGPKDTTFDKRNHRSKAEK